MTTSYTQPRGSRVRPRRDPCFGLSACYGHLKARMGSGDRLSAEEQDFVGYYEPRPSTGGWRQPNTLPTHLSPDMAMLQALMEIEDANQDRLRFLGG